MMILEIIMAVFLTALITAIAGRYSSRIAGVLAILGGSLPLLMLLQFLPLLGYDIGVDLGIEGSATYSFGGVTLGFAATSLGTFFSVMVLALFPVVMLYSVSFVEKNAHTFYPGMLGALAGSLGVLMAADMLTLYIFWEIMSWSVFLLVFRGGSGKAVVSYLTFAVLSAVMILFGIGLLYRSTGTLVMADMDIKGGYVTLFALLSMVLGFGVKGAIMPFHVWAPEVYSRSEEPFVAFLAGGLSKLGYFGIMLVMYGVLGMNVLSSFGTFRSAPTVGYALAVLGAVTAFAATMLAVMEDDLRKLLAYSSIAQLGYIAVGIGIGTPLALSGALFQAFNHTFFKAVLFLAAGSVAYRTGRWRISELGGVAYRMPLTFMAALFSIFALAAIPITSGFAAKWLLYSAAVDMKFIFITPLMLIAGVGSFLYSFRILYGVFLGQPRFQNIKEAPVPQLAAMWILVLPLVIFLIWPGKLMDAINHVLLDLGVGSVPHTDFVINSGLADYSTLAVIFALMGGMLISLSIYISRPHKVVPHSDNYLAGEPSYLYPDISMHTATRFYQPVEDMFWPYFSRGARELWEGLVAAAAFVADGIRRLYSGVAGDYAAYIAIFLIIVGGWFLW